MRLKGTHTRVVSYTYEFIILFHASIFRLFHYFRRLKTILRFITTFCAIYFYTRARTKNNKNYELAFSNLVFIYCTLLHSFFSTLHLFKRHYIRTYIVKYNIRRYCCVTFTLYSFLFPPPSSSTLFISHIRFNSYRSLHKLTCSTI